MAQDKKQRGVNFYFLINKIYREDREEPTKNIWELLTEILNQDIVNRIYDIRSDKFMYLEFAEINTSKIITAFFVSAKNQYRADLIDRTTGKRRKNPKEDTEGEQQKTHICFKLEKDKVKVVVENNGNGVSINQITDYLNFMNKQLYEGINYSIKYNHLIRKDILEKIKGLSRVSLATLRVSKNILGDDMLEYTDKTMDMRQELLLNVYPKRGQSIKNAVIDFFTKMTTGKAPSISSISVKGKDDYKNDVLLDTLDFIMKDSAWFDLNIYGEVETQRAFTILKGYFSHLF